MADDTRAVNLLQKYSEMDSRRSQWKSQWEDIRNLVRVHSRNFYADNRYNKGERKTDNIYDGTAPWALEQLAAALHNYLTSPTSRWFNLAVSDDLPVDHDELTWLEFVSDLLYKEYARPQTNHAAQLHELFLDIPSLGTAVLYQAYNRRGRHLTFRAFPLADCKIEENTDGMVDTVYRDILWRSRQVLQNWDEKQLPDKLLKSITGDKKLSKEHKIIHMVFPRSDRDASKFSKTNKPWASLWLAHDTKEIIDEGGFDSFPYHVPRWSKLSGEVYGRSPAMTCLPDIKMLNQMSKTIIKGAQKVVDPPLMVPDDGFLMPLKTNPGSLLMYEPGTEAVIPLETKGKIHIGHEMEDRRKDQIVKAFFVDWIIRSKKRERQTTTEILDDRNEMLRQMAPMLGRLQTELLGPMLSRSLRLLAMMNRIPPMPPSLENRGISVEYVSPAARAQKMEKGVTIQGFIEAMTVLSQIDKNALDVLDVDQAAAEIAKLNDVPRKIIRSPEDIEKVRQLRKEEEDTERETMLAKEGAGAIKDLAAANQMGGVL